MNTPDDARGRRLPDTDVLPFVEASMAYSDITGDAAHIRVYPPSSGRQSEAPRRKWHTVRVYDVRAVREPLGLDDAGFALLPAPTDFDDFFDADAVRTRYYPEVIATLQSALGAEAVFVFDHNVRSRVRVEAREEGVRSPVDGAHNDYTLSSGPRRIREVLEENGATHLASRRAALVNLWRPLRGPVQDHPLAICDARSTALDDFVPTSIEHYLEDDLVSPHLTGEVYSFRYSDRHRWFYASDMQRDEALLLKCFDTDESVVGRFTGHTGFPNPECPAEYLPRESIEARTVVVY